MRAGDAHGKADVGIFGPVVIGAVAGHLFEHLPAKGDGDAAVHLQFFHPSFSMKRARVAPLGEGLPFAPRMLSNIVVALREPGALDALDRVRDSILLVLRHLDGCASHFSSTMSCRRRNSPKSIVGRSSTKNDAINDGKVIAVIDLHTNARERKQHQKHRKQ